MPQLTEKQTLFAKYMYTPGSESFGNGRKSAKRAGYKGNSLALRQRAHECVTNRNVLSLKKQIQAESAKKARITRDYLIKQANDILANSTNERNKLSALSLLGDFIGAKREHAPNAETEAAKLERLTAEQILRERHFEDARERELAAEVKSLRIVG